MSPHPPFRPSARFPFGSASRLAVLLGASLAFLAPDGLSQSATPSATPAQVRALAPVAPCGPGSDDWPAILAAYESAAGQTYFKSSDSDENDSFGAALAMSGDTLVVSAPGESSNATGVDGDQSNDDAFSSGAVYVFVNDGTSWSQQAYIKASNTEESDLFGSAVTLSGDTLVVSASGEDSTATGVDGDQSDNSGANVGAAYVFVRDGTTWTQQAYIKASNAETSDRFGQGALSLSGDTLVVGALFEDSAASGVDGNQADNSANNTGAAYVFVRDGTTWSQQAYLKAADPDPKDKFGSTVSVSGDTVVVGAGSEDSSATGVDGDQADNSVGNSGAAYVFVRDGTTWSQQAYLKASNSEAADFFGWAVSVSGDTAVVSAFFEDSGATGVDGDQANAAADASGAAYVFVRSGTTWSQQAYLKASNTEADDSFGLAVSIWGDTLVVCASGEDSRATGVDGDQSDNAATNSGAAYIFARSGTAWSQQAYVKASNTGAFDSLSAVSLSDGALAMGAPAEASNATGVYGDQSNNWLISGAAYVQPLGASPWCDLGGGLAGTQGQPLFSASGTLVGGSPATLSLVNGLPGGTTNVVLGFSLLSAPFKGGTLVPSPDLLVTGLPLDGSGAFETTFAWPAGLPAGSIVHWQHWLADAGAPKGFAASNGLSSTQP